MPVDLVQADTLFLLVQQCFFYVFILGFLFLLARFQHQQPFWKSLGWKNPSARRVVIACGGCELAIAASLLLLLLPDYQGFRWRSCSTLELHPSPSAIAIPSLPSLRKWCSAAYCSPFLSARRDGFAVVSTAVLFAGLHVPEYWHAWNHMIMILIVGMVFSLARGVTGSLAPSIILHIGFNSSSWPGSCFPPNIFGLRPACGRDETWVNRIDLMDGGGLSCEFANARRQKGEQMQGLGAVVITGASTGIGEACALHLDKLGYRVFAGIRKAADGESLRSRASERLVPIRLDISDETEIREAARKVVEALGDEGLAGLVNNAGIVVGGMLEFLPLDELRRQLEVNVIGQIAVTQAFLPSLRKARGRIVNIGSLSGLISTPFTGPIAPPNLRWKL